MNMQNMEPEDLMSQLSNLKTESGLEDQGPKNLKKSNGFN